MIPRGGLGGREGNSINPRHPIALSVTDAAAWADWVANLNGLARAVKGKQAYQACPVCHAYPECRLWM